jgi:hypothetical protein
MKLSLVGGLANSCSRPRKHEYSIILSRQQRQPAMRSFAEIKLKTDECMTTLKKRLRTAFTRLDRSAILTIGNDSTRKTIEGTYLRLLRASHG